MLPSVPHASTEQTATVCPDLTIYASLELSRATWLVTCVLPERDRMSSWSFAAEAHLLLHGPGPARIQPNTRLRRELGVTGRFVQNRTLSRPGEERGANIAQRPEPLFGPGGGPDVIARQRDVLPAERGDVGQ